MKRKLPGPGSKRRFECRKCGVNTCRIEEYYVLRTELWRSVVDRWKMDRLGCCASIVLKICLAGRSWPKILSIVL
jgi:hypothetical protein